MSTNDSVYPVNRFLGVRNGARPLRLPWGSLRQANNVTLDNTGTFELRPGYVSALALTAVTDAYGDRYGRFALVVDNGRLKRIDTALTAMDLGLTLAEGVYQWAQQDDRIAFAGQDEAALVDYGSRVLPLRLPYPSPPEVIAQAGNLPPGQYQFTQVFRHVATGLESSAPASVNLVTNAPSSFRVAADPPTGYVSDLYATAANDTTERYLVSTRGGEVLYSQDDLGEPLEDAQIGTYPLPAGVTALAFHQGCLWAATWDAKADIGYIHRSEPFYHQLFRLDENSFARQGRVLGMAGTEQGLIVATELAIWLFDLEENWQMLADYGAVPGRPVFQDWEGRTFIWTVRGQCLFPAFANTFKDGDFGWKLSVRPGSRVSNGAIHRDGLSLAVALTDEAQDAYNLYG